MKLGSDTYSYTYDDLGNITQITKNGTVLESYEYDSLSQLTKVTNSQGVFEYTYDDGGNILSVTKDGEEIKDYTYGDASWKDLLTAFNGDTITYDNIGNPLTYRDGMTFTWENGRQLATINNNISYAYNADGNRISKIVNNVETEYFWLDGVLLGEKTGTNTILYLYDDSGVKYGFDLNGTRYYYILNLQGDVIGILDSAGTQVVSYTYDAWGNLLSTTGSQASTIGQLNPIRYRGYYYDAETEFYFLNSRYYDPEVNRFVNSDGAISGIGQDIRGYNLFAYCFNNPVNMSDPTGNWPRWITAAVAAVATVVAAVAVVVSAPVVAVVATTVAVVASVTYVAQSHHYDKRKEKNTNLPTTAKQATESGWKSSKDKKNPQADCHQYTSKDKSNIKFVSPDGHKEVIYNSAGKIVTDSRDIGTYNFSPPTTFWGNIGHFFVDMLPWYLFGNDDDDPGPLLNEIIQLFE